MARYTCSKIVSESLGNCFSRLKVFLDNYALEILFCKEDCLIAREIPGQVPFTQLVTIEVSMDGATAATDATQMDVVVTNEELPFQSHNHCHQIFAQLSKELDF